MPNDDDDADKLLDELLSPPSRRLVSLGQEGVRNLLREVFSPKYDADGKQGRADREARRAQRQN